MLPDTFFGWCGDWTFAVLNLCCRRYGWIVVEKKNRSYSLDYEKGGIQWEDQKKKKKGQMVRIREILAHFHETHFWQKIRKHWKFWQNVKNEGHSVRDFKNLSQIIKKKWVIRWERVEKIGISGWERVEKGVNVTSIPVSNF